jgi:hypothetical protein
VSGLPLADYFRINIFDKYGLHSTLYDPTNGALGIHKQQLPFPAYITYLQPGQDDALADTSGATIEQVAASSGSPRYWGGDVRKPTALNASIGATATATALINRSGSSSRGMMSVGMTAKYPGPSGFDWTLANAAGAVVSTPQDMGKWFRALLVEPDHLGLGKQLLREFLTLSTDVPHMPLLNVTSGNGSVMNATLVFAQGLVVMKDPDHARGLGVSNVYYLGSLGGFQASIYMRLDPTDPAKDVFVNAVAATVIPDKKDWPAAAQNLTAEQCLQAHKSADAGGAASIANKSSSNDSSTTAAGGRHRRLLNAALLKLVAGAAPSAAAVAEEQVHAEPGVPQAEYVEGVLCALSSMVPSAIKTVPDMLARQAFKELTGSDWFDLV